MGILFECGLLNIGVDHDKIIFPFPGEGLVLVFAVGWEVAKEKSPTCASIF